MCEMIPATLARGNGRECEAWAILAYFSPTGSLTANATSAASASITPPTVAKPALSEKVANIAAPIGPTMNAIAWALLPMPKAVPRRSRLTLSAIMVLVAGIIDALRNEARVKASTRVTHGMPHRHLKDNNISWLN